MNRYILTDKYTGEILDTSPLRRTKSRTKRSRAPRRIKTHHEAFVAMAATLGLWIAIAN